MSTTETPQEAAAGSPVVGAAIREARVKAEMTQDDLAEALGVTQACVSYWENARRDLGVTDLLRVAAAINVPVVDLLGVAYFDAPATLPSQCATASVADFGPVRLELMGHRYREGHLSEVVIAGTPFLRLDLDGGAAEFYAPSSVYCISPGLVPPPVPRAEIPARFGWQAVNEDEDDLGR